MIAGKSWIRNWINEHPAVWEFILFNVLSNVATIVNFIAIVDLHRFPVLYL